MFNYCPGCDGVLTIVSYKKNDIDTIGYTCTTCNNNYIDGDTVLKLHLEKKDVQLRSNVGCRSNATD